jgi:hypothetical protein
MSKKTERINRTIEICCHTISYYYDKDMEIPESEEQRVKESIGEGYNQGELNYCNGKTENHGWWSIES